MLVLWPPPLRPNHPPFLRGPPAAQTKFSLGQVRADLCERLAAIAAAMAAYNFREAELLVSDMAARDWAATKEFIKGPKTLVALGLAKSST